MRRRFAERDEHGVVAPSRVMLVAVVGVAIAGAAFFATTPQPEQQARVASAQPTPTPTATPTPTPTATPTKKATPKKKPVVVKRGETIVVVFNNSGITGLAGRTSGRARGAGWNVVGSDNWYGTIPATTVYYPQRLQAAAKVLARDLGIRRIKPAIDPMQGDRLTVILTTDYAS